MKLLKKRAKQRKVMTFDKATREQTFALVMQVDATSTTSLLTSRPRNGTLSSVHACLVAGPASDSGTLAVVSSLDPLLSALICSPLFWTSFLDLPSFFLR